MNDEEKIENLQYTNSTAVVEYPIDAKYGLKKIANILNEPVELELVNTFEILKDINKIGE